jgi:glycosyltransferase involved in cell wall biosynthesis
LSNSKNINIVIFSSLESFGGGRETWLFNIIPKLASYKNIQKINVFYFKDFFSNDNYVRNKLNLDNVVLNGINLPILTSKLSALKRILLFSYKCTLALRKSNEKNIVLAIGTFYEGVVLSLLKSSMLHPPLLILWIRGILEKEVNHRVNFISKYFFLLVEKINFSLVDYVIANGYDTKIYYEKKMGIKISPIPNAIDQKLYANITRKAFLDSKIKISFIGRLSQEKGILDFLKSIEIYLNKKKKDTIKFEIIGDGKLKDNVIKLCTKYGSHNVCYLGPLSNDKVVDYLSTTDCVVHLTYSQNNGGGGISNSLLETVASQRLALCWDSIIYRQVLDVTQTFFISEGSVNDLANIYAFISSNRSIVKDKINRSKDSLKYYTFDHHIKSLNNVFSLIK